MVNERKTGFTPIELITTVATLGMVSLVGVGFYKGFKAVNRYINTPEISVERAHVIGDERAEQFIEFKGRRFYSEIDGRSVESYSTNTHSR